MSHRHVTVWHISEPKISANINSRPIILLHHVSWYQGDNVTHFGSMTATTGNRKKLIVIFSWRCDIIWNFYFYLYFFSKQLFGWYNDEIWYFMYLNHLQHFKLTFSTNFGNQYCTLGFFGINWPPNFNKL